jgi:hypothetical protein
VLLLSLPLWWATSHFVPGLTATRVVATAICYTLHDAKETQLQQAYAVARTKIAADATFEPSENPDGQGATYYLSATADTPERARTDLAALTEALKAASPQADRNLLVSPNNSTVPEYNALGRRITFGLRATVVLVILGGQLLTVIGGYRAGWSRASLFAALACPIVIFISASSGSDGARRRTGHGNAIELPDWRFTVLLLALTLVSAILILWLTRRKPLPGRKPRHYTNRANH